MELGTTVIYYPYAEGRKKAKVAKGLALSAKLLKRYPNDNISMTCKEG